MKRRMALALAFSLTTIVGFAIVALGSSAGFFSWSGAEAEVITEYIYIDQYVTTESEATTAVLAVATPVPTPVQEIKLGEEGLKGEVLVVWNDGSFFLATKYGDYVLRVDGRTEIKQGTVIEVGARLKTKVEVIDGTYQTPNEDGTFNARKIKTDDKPKPIVRKVDKDDD